MRAGAARDLVTVYRRHETKDGYGDVDAGYAAEATQAWVDIRRDNGILLDSGPGEEQRASAKGRAHYLADIQPRDVLRVTAGPDEGTDWMVTAAFHAGAQDLDLALEQFTGSLP